MKPLFELEKTPFNIDWKVLKIKRVLDTPITDGPHETPELLDEGIPFLSAESVKKGKLDFNFKRGYISQEDHEKYIKKCKPQRDDIFMIKSGATTGNVAMVETDEEFSIWSPLALIRADKKKILPKYLYYFIGSVAFREQVEISWSFGTQQNIGMKVIENLFISVPPIHFQEKLVQYMESKVVQIDKLVEMKEKKISLLEQQRQSIITEAVTKGINPNAKMKDSGVEWIGEIPEHWEVTKIKYTTYVKGRIGWQGLKSDEFIDEGPFLVTGTDFTQGFVNWDTCYHISEERYNEAPPIQLQENDLLITKDGTIGKLAIVKGMPYKAILNSGVFVTRPIHNKYLSKYMYWLLSSTIFEKYIKFMETGSTIKHLYQETFVNFSYPIPSIIEQTEILHYLDIKIREIDSIKSNILKQIEKLKEYRQALIYEAVTGKIDVRDMELD
ncbi:restriction endonuclease subunit S [Shouchella clausii]|uniref:restriction endonuclease subunit S n=1 Tax=Shouchella clausii TaxID=79880 RepID=UPI000D1E947D|nr:restriction endonuclease subunit S [Shouchella clausii]PTL22122.1 restriction endonuclease subunit S [Shouchella clausii]